MKSLILAVSLAALSHSVDATPDPEYRAEVGVCQPVATPQGVMVQCRIMEDMTGPHRSEAACKNRLRQMTALLRQRYPHARLLPQCMSNVPGLPI